MNICCCKGAVGTPLKEYFGLIYYSCNMEDMVSGWMYGAMFILPIFVYFFLTAEALPKKDRC